MSNHPTTKVDLLRAKYFVTTKKPSRDFVRLALAGNIGNLRGGKNGF